MPEEKIDVCSLWEERWVKSQPPGNVKKAIAKGSVRLGCLTEEQKKELGLIPSGKGKKGE